MNGTRMLAVNNENAIQIGDTVRVASHVGKTLLFAEATVCHMPTKPGDYWIFKGVPANGRILSQEEIAYVYEPITVYKKIGEQNESV